MNNASRREAGAISRDEAPLRSALVILSRKGFKPERTAQHTSWGAAEGVLGDRFRRAADIENHADTLRVTHLAYQDTTQSQTTMIDTLIGLKALTENLAVLSFNVERYQGDGRSDAPEGLMCWNRHRRERGEPR